MKITMYELLGLVKDGKAPKKILYNDIEHENYKLQKENKILKENAENNNKVVDKVNWENMLLKKENEQLKDNWNKLKEWVNKHYDYYMNNEDYIGGRLCFTDMKDKMQELEQGSDK